MSEQKLIEIISALLALDEKRALVPHGLGGHARELMQRSVTALADYDALAAQRDEGLARENQLREERDSYQRVGIQAQQHLAEAIERVKESQAELLDMKANIGFRGLTLGVIGRNDHFISNVSNASPGGADWEQQS